MEQFATNNEAHILATKEILVESNNSSILSNSKETFISNKERLNSLNSPLSTVYLKTPDINCLINDEELRSILSTNPWDVNIKQTLSQFQERIFKNAQIRFRIGGKVLYSASQIVRAKSSMMLQESLDTQDELQINEVDEDDLDSDEEIYEGSNSNDKYYENIHDILGTSNSSILLEESIVNNKQISEYIALRNQELISAISTKPFFSVDKSGQRFLSAPIRKVFKKIDFGDLGNALMKSLHYQINSTSQTKFRYNSKVNINKIFPQNILKKAEEERALVELQIQRMHEKILLKFNDSNCEEPISFIELIITPDPDGIVRTLLYLLQLVNRKQVELWQKIDEDQDLSENESDLDIFITPFIQKEIASK